jgi:MATE family multidrug resistance protein
MSPVRKEVGAITRIAVPVAASHLGTMMLWVVDMLMIGAVGVSELDAVALGRLWIMGTVVVAMGVVMGIDPLIAQAHGAKDAHLMGVTLQRGLIIGLAISVPTAICWLFTGPFLVLTGQDPGLAAEAHRYVTVQIVGIPAILSYVVLRQYLLDRGVAAPVMWTTVIANVVNVFANWVLIFGKLGFPAMGVVGAGVATVVTQFCLLIALATWMATGRGLEGGWTGWSREAFERSGLVRVLQYGAPVGLQLGLELWAFVAANLLAGWIGKIELAAHAIVINLASITFMVPMGISFGVVTRVGNLIGEGRPRDAQRSAWIGLFLGGAVMMLSAAVFIVGREWLPALYTRDAAVIALCAGLLPIAAAFQLFDGVQVVGGGVLRGMGRTRPAAVFNMIAYYGLALPLAYWLGFPGGHGLSGIWWGLAIGLAVVAVLLVGWVAIRGPARVDALVIPTRATK